MKILNKNNIVKRACAMLLFIAQLLVICSLPISAVADGEKGKLPAQSDTVYQTLYPSDILKLITNSDITVAERDHLDGMAALGDEVISSFTVRYNAALPTDRINVEILEESAESVTIKVTVERIDSDGITWLPVSINVTVDEKTQSKAADSGREYTFEFDKTANSKNAVVSAEYTARFDLDKADVDALINSAYLAGNDAYSEMQRYLSDKKEYDENIKKHEEYTKKLEIYNIENRKYLRYLEDMKAYEGDIKAYEAYLSNMEKYDSDMEKYDTYLADYGKYLADYALYEDFILNPKKYENAYKKYCDYLSEIEKVNRQLSYIDSCFVTDSEGHMLHATLHGDTVATVVSNQDALVAAGCDPDGLYIPTADRATKQLTALLDAYPKNGTEAERYNYYIANYKDFKDSVYDLYNSLARLYTYEAVPAILEAKDRLERYWQFVSQLYVLHTVIDDDPSANFNPNWTIANTHPDELLEDCYMLADINGATPMQAYPTAVSEAVSPADIKEPRPPKKVELPIRPSDVLMPQKPVEVAKPLLPAVVSHPGEAPLEPRFTAAVNKLSEDVASGALTPRNEQNIPSHITQSVSVERAISLKGYATASFYMIGTSAIEKLITVPIGEEMTLPTPEGKILDQREYVYTIVGWTNNDASYSLGEKITLASDMSYMPSYTSYAALYDVKWHIGAVSHTESYRYGEVPSYSGSVMDEIEQNTDSDYAFDGWDSKPSPVLGEGGEYSAVISVTPKIFTVTWKIGNAEFTQNVKYGEVPNFTDADILTIEAEKLSEQSGGRFTYTFAGWDSKIEGATSNITYTALFESKDLIPNLPEGYIAAVSADSSLITLTVNANAMPENISLDITGILDMAAGRSLAVNICGVNIHLRRADILDVGLDIENGVTLKVVLAADGLCFTVMNGREAVKMPLDITLPLDRYGYFENSTVKLTLNQEDVPFLKKDGKIQFTAENSAKYELTGGYTVMLEAQDGGVVMVEDGAIYADKSTAFAKAGSTVTLSPVSRAGYRLLGINITAGSGDSIRVTSEKNGTYTFVMPEDSVSIKADFEKLKYIVTFVSDGVVISQNSYFYGDEPIMPSEPKKDADGEYSYRFAGWDKDVRTVTEDATYTAVFLSSKIADETTVPEGKLSIGDMILIASISCIIACGGMLSAFFVVRHGKRRPQRRKIK